MSEVCICGLDELRRQSGVVRPSHLISLVPPEQQPPTPTAVPQSNHLRVAFHDATEPDPDWVLPERHHIDLLIQFVKKWPQERPLLLHCVVGVSRSPAAAMITLAVLRPGRPEEAVHAVRRYAPHCRPNRLMIELADLILDLNGQLTRAVGSLEPPDYSHALPDLVRIPLK